MNIIKYILFAVLLIVNVSVFADNTTYIEEVGEPHIQTGYYMDGNGIMYPYTVQSPYNRKYEDWTYLDENGYDYTIQIEIK